MAPMHEWKDDAEFLRYNRPKQSKIACFICNIDPEGRIWEIVFVALLVVAILWLR